MGTEYIYDPNGSTHFTITIAVWFLAPANEVWGKVIFSVACVKNSVRGGSASVHAGIPHKPPGADTLPGTRHPTLPEQTPPPLCSACWEMWSTSGRYASYWNAILFRFETERLQTLKDKIVASLGNIRAYHLILNNSIFKPWKTRGVLTIFCVRCAGWKKVYARLIL